MTINEPRFVCLSIVVMLILLAFMLIPNLSGTSSPDTHLSLGSSPGSVVSPPTPGEQTN